MKLKTWIAVALAATTMTAQASPRTDYLQDRLNQARAVEIQAKRKSEAEVARYKATKSARKTIEHELKSVRKREDREYRQAREAYHAARLDVESMYQGDMSAPTGITWRSR